MYSLENMIPDLNTVDYAISSYPLSLYDRCFHFPIGMRNSSRNDYLRQRSDGSIRFTKEDLQKKTIFANFCASHDSCDGKRAAFFEQLCEQYKKVDSIGSFRNNTDITVKMSDGSKWDFQRKCKFSLCFESVSQEGFNTEKLVDAFYTDTIPVYYGDPYIGDIFNTKAFINVRDYPSFDAAIDSASPCGWKLFRTERHGTGRHQPGQRGGYRPPGSAWENQRSGHLPEGRSPASQRDSRRLPAAMLLL